MFINLQITPLTYTVRTICGEIGEWQLLIILRITTPIGTRRRYLGELAFVI